MFLLEGVLCYGFGMIDASETVCEAVSLCLMGINIVLMLPYISKRYAKYGKTVVTFLILSLLLKAALVLWDYYATGIFVLPNSHADSESYHRGAVLFAIYGSIGIENYSFVVGVIYKLFGVQRMTAQFFNVLLSFLGISVFERTMCEAELSDRAKRRALALAALLPNYLIMASILIRECLISVILCWSLYLFITWWKRGNPAYLFCAMLVTLLACYFHSGAIAATIGYSIAPILTRRERGGERSVHISIKSVVLAVVCVVVFMYLFDALSDSLLGKFHGLGMEVIEDYIDGHNIYISRPSDDMGSTYTAGFGEARGLRGLIINAPIRMFYFLWVPMPWSMRGLNDLIAFVGSSLFYGGTVFRAIAALRQRRRPHYPLLVCVLIICLVGCLVFAWGVDNAGSALRHREKFYFIFLLLYACLDEPACERQPERPNRGRFSSEGIKWKTIY